MTAHGCAALCVYMWLGNSLLLHPQQPAPCKERREKNEVEKGEREKSAGMHSLSLCRNAKQLQIYASIIFDEFI